MYSLKEKLTIIKIKKRKKIAIQLKVTKILMHKEISTILNLLKTLSYNAWFPWTARCKAVALSAVFKSGFAPYSKRSFTQLTNPCWAAIMRGVAQSSAPIFTAYSWPNSRKDNTHHFFFF